MKDELEKIKEQVFKCAMSSLSDFTGKAIIISAPSGAGKTTLNQKTTRKWTSVKFSISACSRKPRKDEINGKDC